MVTLPVELTRYLEFVTIAIPTAYEDEDSSISTLKELNHPYLTGSPHSTIIRAVAEATDGMLDRIAGCIDARTIVAFRRALDEAPDA